MYKRTSDYTFVATLLFQLVQKMRFTWSTTLAGRLCLNLFPGCACDSSGYLFCISTSRVLERGRGEEEKNSCHPGQRGHSSFIGDNVGSIFFHNRQRAFSSVINNGPFLPQSAPEGVFCAARPRQGSSPVLCLRHRSCFPPQSSPRGNLPRRQAASRELACALPAPSILPWLFRFF